MEQKNDGKHSKRYKNYLHKQIIKIKNNFRSHK